MRRRVYVILSIALLGFVSSASAEISAVQYSESSAQVAYAPPGGDCKWPDNRRSCAYHCTDRAECLRCCLNFDNEEDYANCKTRCNDRWPATTANVATESLEQLLK